MSKYLVRIERGDAVDIEHVTEAPDDYVARAETVRLYQHELEAGAAYWVTSTEVNYDE